MKNTILYCGFGWASNIGNAFIDYSIMDSLKKVCNNDIHFTSNMQSWLKHRYAERLGFLTKSNKDVQQNDFDLRSIIKAHYYLFGGALLNRAWFNDNSRIIKKLISDKSKVVLYGVSGGNDYSQDEIKYVRDILNKLNLYALVSRDNETYENFSDLAEYSYSGIDCAFFINDFFTPAEFNFENYIVVTFDHFKEPDIKTEKKIIRLYHSAWDLGRIENLLKAPIKTTKLMGSNDLISDFPDDYLNIYANCDATYSDRVHACVATLAFGKKAQYFGKSPRSLLFERVGLNDIKDHLVNLDHEKIKIEKENQLKFLENIFS